MTPLGIALALGFGGNAQGAVPPPAVPINLTLPALSTTVARVGVVLSADNGTWDGATGYSHQWQSFDGSNWMNIDLAIASEFTPDGILRGRSLRCVVTATNDAGSVDAATNESDATLSVEGPEGPGLLQPPELSYINEPPHVFEIIAIDSGIWLDALGYSYWWMANGADIISASGNSYQLTDHDLGKVISCRVTAHGVEANTVAYSNETGAVEAALPRPEISTFQGFFNGSIFQTYGEGLGIVVATVDIELHCLWARIDIEFQPSVPNVSWYHEVAITEWDSAEVVAEKFRMVLEAIGFVVSQDTDTLTVQGDTDGERPDSFNWGGCTAVTTAQQGIP